MGRSTGVAAFNIIPDRNYTPGQKDQKLENLNQVVKLTQDLGLPLLGGTEMNSPGQKFVDDFSSAELAPITISFSGFLDFTCPFNTAKVCRDGLSE